MSDFLERWGNQVAKAVTPSTTTFSVNAPRILMGAVSERDALTAQRATLTDYLRSRILAEDWRLTAALAMELYAIDEQLKVMPRG